MTNGRYLRARHPVTGRFLAFDCEIDCQEHCAGLCGPMTERVVSCCLAHMVEYPLGGRCPTCASYIAAGL